MPSSAAPPNKAAPLSSHCPESCSTIPGSPWQNFQQSDQVIKNYQSMGWKHGAPNATVAPDQTGITYQLGYGLAGTSTYTSQAPDEGIPFAANDQPPAVECKFTKGVKTPMSKLCIIGLIIRLSYFFGVHSMTHNAAYTKFMLICSKEEV